MTHTLDGEGAVDLSCQCGSYFSSGDPEYIAEHLPAWLKHHGGSRKGWL